MEEPMGARPDLEPWAAIWSWTWAGGWWSPPSRSPAGAAAGPGRHRRRRPHHERATLSEREERTLLDLETGLPRTSSPRVRSSLGRATRALLAVLLLLLAVVLSIDGAGAGSFGLLVLLAVVTAVAWIRDGDGGSSGRRA
jgi:hypothetical protein